MITVTQTYGGNFIVPPAMSNLRRQGVPPGGPADPILAQLVSHLSQNQTVLEITSPITLVAECLTQIAIAAPQYSACIPDHPTMCLGSISASPNTPLVIQAPKTGFRVYLSWIGLNSQSLLPNPITQDQSLTSSIHNSSRTIILDPDLISTPTNIIRYLPIIENAPRFRCLTTPSISRIGTRLSIDNLDPFETRSIGSGGNRQEIRLNSNFAVSPPLGEDSGGGRLDKSIDDTGSPPECEPAKTSLHLFHNLTPYTRSEPSTHGAIQVTPDNQLLIHGPDGPTLGGYPKIGSIIEADLPSLAQLRPGQKIELIPVSLEIALKLRRESASYFQKTLLQINQALRIVHNST